MKKHIVLIVITLVVIILSYFTGYETCKKHYDNYYNATEKMIDSIDGDYFMDIIMEGDAYQDYLKAKEELQMGIIIVLLVFFLVLVPIMIVANKVGEQIEKWFEEHYPNVEE